MKKLTIKKIVEFRSKQDKGKKNFATDLNIDKAKAGTESGGDYWITSLSAISNSFKADNLQSINDKRNELEEKLRETEVLNTKKMYRRNINILSTYKEVNLQKWKPGKGIEFLKKRNEDALVNIKGLHVQISPHHVYVFNKNGIKEIGAIWFIAKLNGFRKDELGMFTDILYRYLKLHFSEESVINRKYCIAVDVINNFELNYLQLEKAEVPFILNSTLDEIKKFM